MSSYECCRAAQASNGRHKARPQPVLPRPANGPRGLCWPWQRAAACTAWPEACTAEAGCATCSRTDGSAGAAGHVLPSRQLPSDLGRQLAVGAARGGQGLHAQLHRPLLLADGVEVGVLEQLAGSGALCPGADAQGDDGLQLPAVHLLQPLRPDALHSSHTVRVWMSGSNFVCETAAACSREVFCTSACLHRSHTLMPAHEEAVMAQIDQDIQCTAATQPAS